VTFEARVASNAIVRSSMRGFGAWSLSLSFQLDKTSVAPFDPVQAEGALRKDRRHIDFR
jgi:hypothetical protein